MQAEWTIPVGTLYSFLLVLARVSGVLMLVPLPGFRSGTALPRAALALAFTLALFPLWPPVPVFEPGIGCLAGWLVLEAALGVIAGVAVAFVSEALVFTAELIGLHAGYAYASTIDPGTQANSGVLLILAQLVGGLLFFACGLDREVLRIFARSLDAVPFGAFVLSPAMAGTVVRVGAGMFVLGLRLALPVLALVLLVDVALALLGKLNQQLQFLTLALPAKMLAAVAVLSWILVLFPGLYRAYAAQVLAAWRALF